MQTSFSLGSSGKNAKYSPTGFELAQRYFLAAGQQRFWITPFTVPRRPGVARFFLPPVGLLSRRSGPVVTGGFEFGLRVGLMQV